MPRHSETTSESESDSDYAAPPKKKARTSNPKGAKTRSPTTKAEVTISATDTSSRTKSETQKRLDEIGDAVIGRIRKALALASHPQTGEDEARAALRMASKLLERHNVTQADIISQETETEQLKRAGQSVVSIKNIVKPSTAVSLEQWTQTLAAAMDTFFDCQSYTTKFNGVLPRVEWTFYGLAEQTVAAAHAFEMTYNLISAWSLRPNVGKGIHAKNCYRSGVATGLHAMAKKEKKEDKKRAIKKESALLKARQEQEAAEDKSRVERLKGPEIAAIAGPVESTEAKFKVEEPTEDKTKPDRRVKIEEVDDEDSFGGRKALDTASMLEAAARTCEDDSDPEDCPAFSEVAPDFNDSDDDEHLLDLDADKPTVKRQESVPPMPGLMAPPASAVPLLEQKIKDEPDDDSPWASVGQLVAFRESSIAIGDDYLKAQGVKLLKGRKSKGLEFKDSEARRIYQLGKKDAEKIDVRQRQLMDE
ncbi:hypothetical protein B0H15DRAFT_1023892 [Mycena belliarum]|uniref:DUF2786 domain-containing protein n=1 Tax=Mycena belliarum TaxID=1033014 RepID=A0AAD6U272_9AGAR|nr:hypothetical protein B0H15DRAFT_1023892 [Mycena belliae]